MAIFLVFGAAKATLVIECDNTIHFPDFLSNKAYSLPLVVSPLFTLFISRGRGFKVAFAVRGERQASVDILRLKFGIIAQLLAVQQGDNVLASCGVGDGGSLRPTPWQEILDAIEKASVCDLSGY